MQFKEQKLFKIYKNSLENGVLRFYEAFNLQLLNKTKSTAAIHTENKTNIKAGEVAQQLRSMGALQRTGTHMVTHKPL